MSQPFDPTRHLMKIKGKDYLETKWRLVWLRDVHPNASVETELVRADDNGVTVRADVSWPVMTPAGDGYHVHIVHNTGYAMELWDKPGRIGAALENAETSALGRALAAAGFGPQFAPELDFDAGGERVADSPVQHAPQARLTRDERRYPVQDYAALLDAQASARAAVAPRQAPAGDPSEPITTEQTRQLYDLGRAQNIYVKRWVSEQFGGRTVDSLTRGEAESIIADWTPQTAGVS